MKTLKIEIDFDNSEQLKSFLRTFENSFCGMVSEKSKEKRYRITK